MDNLGADFSEEDGVVTGITNTETKCKVKTTDKVEHRSLCEVAEIKSHDEFERDLGIRARSRSQPQSALQRKPVEIGHRSALDKNLDVHSVAEISPHDESEKDHGIRARSRSQPQSALQRNPVEIGHRSTLDKNLDFHSVPETTPHDESEKDHGIRARTRSQPQSALQRSPVEIGHRSTLDKNLYFHSVPEISPQDESEKEVGLRARSRSQPQSALQRSPVEIGHRNTLGKNLDVHSVAEISPRDESEKDHGIRARTRSQPQSALQRSPVEIGHRSTLEKNLDVHSVAEISPHDESEKEVGTRARTTSQPQSALQRSAVEIGHRNTLGKNLDVHSVAEISPRDESEKDHGIRARTRSQPQSALQRSPVEIGHRSTLDKNLDFHSVPETTPHDESEKFVGMMARTRSQPQSALQRSPVEIGHRSTLDKNLYFHSVPETTPHDESEKDHGMMARTRSQPQFFVQRDPVAIRHSTSFKTPAVHSVAEISPHDEFEKEIGMRARTRSQPQSALQRKQIEMVHRSTLDKNSAVDSVAEISPHDEFEKDLGMRARTRSQPQSALQRKQIEMVHRSTLDKNPAVHSVAEISPHDEFEKDLGMRARTMSQPQFELQRNPVEIGHSTSYKTPDVHSVAEVAPHDESEKDSQPQSTIQRNPGEIGHGSIHEVEEITAQDEFEQDVEIRARTMSQPQPAHQKNPVKKRHSEQSLLKVLQRKKKMEMRSNASTEDLIALAAASHKTRQRQGDTSSQLDEIGPDQTTPPYPLNPDGSLSSFPSATSLQSSRNTTPHDSPKSTPSTTRKVKPALKLTLEDSTWTPPQRPKPSTSTKIRKNIQTGAAKVNSVVQLSRTPEFRFRFVLVLLFCFIVSTVTFTWYLYQKQMLQLTIGDKIKFLETRRILNFLRDDGNDLMKGTVGLHIPPELSPYDCQSLRRTAGPNICMEWKYRARLQINVAHETNVSCYTVHWESLEKGTVLKDCFNLRGAHWYGMGELRHSSWPFRNTKMKMQAMVTGDLNKSDFGGILERYWLSSSGIGIRVESYVPLFVSLNATGDDHLCFESHFDEFPYKSPSRSSLPTLEYTICTGPNAKAVHVSMMKQFAVLPSNLSTTEFMQAPLWSTYPKLRNHMTQEALKNFSHHIIQHGFDDPGFIFFDESWQNKLGDLEFKSANIPNPENILQVLRNKGFKILMTVHPYICLDSEIFANATTGNYLVSDSQLRVPLLTRWPESNSICSIIDLTKNASSEWFVNRLKDLKTKYQIDGFFFLGGQSSFLPQSYHFNHSSVNPDEFLHHYADTAADVGTMTGLSFGFKSQNKLSFVRLAPRQSTWNSSRGLQSVIPTVLNLGLLGYPLVNPGSVGGDELPGENPDFEQPGNRTIPDNELYLRWLQMVVFLPVVQFSVPPADYGLDGIKVAKVLLTTRKKKVFPVIQRCLREFLATGAPIVRPLWWLAPNDPATYGLENQFAIGDEIIVAPVTEPGKRNREVYLPHGFWKDENQATTWRGGRWHHNYSVPLEKVAYFIRTDDPKLKGD